MINLTEWAKAHPATEYTWKGVTRPILGRTKISPKLNSLQVLHRNNELDLYEPVEAYSERWEHESEKPLIGKKHGKFISAHPVPNTKVRNDLPPIYIQWKESHRIRCGKNKHI